METLLSIIIAIIVFGVFLGIARFTIRKWFPEFMEFFQVFVWIALAILFIHCLIAIWPFLTGALTSYRRYAALSVLSGREGWSSVR